MLHLIPRTKLITECVTGLRFKSTNVSLASEFHPNWCQWPHILIQECVTGRRFEAGDANLDEILKPVTHLWIFI